MKRSLVCIALALATSGCIQNHKDLRRTLAENERILAEEQERADSLMQARTALDQLERAVREGVASSPELQKEIDALPPVDTTPPTFPALPAPPEAGSFEGPEGGRLRRHIEETQARIVQLRRVTAEVIRIEAERKRLEAARKIIEAKQQGP